ncbi:MAG: hypothetical protein C5S49_07105 [Candidatus Methanogaster sp.]|nr:MAG: hypothetical protein C5S49_07105 [ANME-2 cluster archaeon]
MRFVSGLYNRPGGRQVALPVEMSMRGLRYKREGMGGEVADFPRFN